MSENHVSHLISSIPSSPYILINNTMPAMTNAKLPVIVLDRCMVRPFSDTVKTAVFTNPLSLTIRPSERWAVTGPRKNELLRVLAGRDIAVPPLSRQYPFLQKAAWPSQVTQFLEFRGSVPVSHLSARYEHFRDEFDISLTEFLCQALGVPNEPHNYEVSKVMHQLRLDGLGDRWIVGLSNGQMRRARLAKALLKHPRLLLIDDPYLGLDPSSRETLSDVLELLPPNPHVLLGLRVQDRFPDWITHVAVTDTNGIAAQGPLHEVEPHLTVLRRAEREKTAATLRSHSLRKTAVAKSDDIILKIDKISIAYNGQPVLKDLSWKVRRGEKWHLRGDNGTGKSTLLSLITADHPQSWNSKIIINGKPRKTGNHSYFSINEIIGHAAPEIHTLFPLKLSVFDAVSTGYVVGSMIPPRENLTPEQRAHINELLTEFNLDPDTPLSELSISDQKTVLFLRAIVKHPDILILDEAFSAMDSWRVEQRKQFMSNWQGTVITVGHIDEELPLCDKYIRLLPGPKTPEEGDINHHHE